MKMRLWLLCMLIAGAACAQDSDRTASVGEYFRTHNEALADTPHPGNTPRKFSWVQKVTAFERDGWKCVVCADTENLEMDHAVALMNGGSNDIDNLYALCHTCHVVKTRMDRSLKRQRVKLVQSTGPGP